MPRTIHSLLFLLLIIAQAVFANTREMPVHDLEHVVPVINNHTTQRSISRNGLSAIFKMRLHQWRDGTPVTVFVLKDSNPLHKRFCKEMLNVFPHQLRRVWNKLVFSGSGQAPIILNDITEMQKRIRETPGAIGYLKAGDVHDGMHILDIE